MPLDPAIRKQRQVYLGELKASLVYKVCSRTARALHREACLKKHKNTKTKNQQQQKQKQNKTKETERERENGGKKGGRKEGRKGRRKEGRKDREKEKENASIRLGCRKTVNHFLNW